MGLFDKLREPIVLKEESDTRKQLEQLNLLLPQANGETKAQIEQDIKYLQYGIYGENALMFELKSPGFLMSAIKSRSECFLQSMITRNAPTPQQIQVITQWRMLWPVLYSLNPL